ncbi:hypothetical protein F4678DRAFT_436805 [Xylaria arbuscula]|nr:hypothetical protein F4678DRAFT_436805 [Xylaria arbuscula]
MYNSWISYGLSRNYPYKWVTPVTVVGGLVAIGVSTFINIVTASYDLVAASTSNITQFKGEWNPYANSVLLSYLAQGTQPTCVSATLPINSQIFTTNYAIPYTISSVWKLNQDGSRDEQGSLVYLDNQLLDCNVTAVTIEVRGKYSQNLLLFARSRVGLLLTASATCAINATGSQSKRNREGDITYFNLLGSYSFTDDSISTFLLRNKTEKASLFWGESLLSLYSLVSSEAYYNAARDKPWGSNNNSGIGQDAYNAWIKLTRQSSLINGSAEEVISNEFFNVECYTELNWCGNHTIPWLLEGSHVDDREFDPYPSIWTSIDFLGKSMWFTAMTDLGQNHTSIPNMLAYPDLLTNLTRNVTNEVQAFEAIQDSPNRGGSLMIDTSLETTSFDSSAMPQPGLGARDSFLSTNYICQTPQMKPPATQALAILIADLVLLQTIWMVYKIVLDAVVLRRGDPSLKYCEGCLENHLGNTVEPMRDFSTPTLKGQKSYGDGGSPNETVLRLKEYARLHQIERDEDLDTL